MAKLEEDASGGRCIPRDIEALLIPLHRFFMKHALNWNFVITLYTSAFRSSQKRCKFPSVSGLHKAPHIQGDFQSPLYTGTSCSHQGLRKARCILMFHEASQICRGFISPPRYKPLCTGVYVACKNLFSSRNFMQFQVKPF